MNWLNNHKSNVTSQRGEDGIIQAIFNFIDTNNLWCIECGAGNGKNMSNTWNLINNYDWNGILIEANHRRFVRLRNLYKSNPKVHCIHKLVDCKEFDLTLKTVSECPINPDLCVIDIDGNDWWLWYYMTEYKPRVLMIEFNPTIPYWDHIVQPIDSIHPYGCSLQALVNCGFEKGYELVAVTEFNAIFVIKELYQYLDIEDNSLPVMANHTLQAITYSFQTYDDKDMLGGANTRLWKSKKRRVNAKNID